MAEVSQVRPLPGRNSAHAWGRAQARRGLAGASPPPGRAAPTHPRRHARHRCGRTFLIYLAERHARGTDIHSIGDAFFFTTVQLLTVSSQIRNPFTPFGRAVDIVLEAWAVLVVAGSAGAFASFLQDTT